MEILKNFGFEPSLFFAQIINFLILAYVFKRFLYKPILTLLKTREEKIKKGIKDAENAHILKEEAQKERNEILKQARVEAQMLIDDAKKMAEEAKLQIQEQSKQEAEKIMQDTKLQAQLYMQNMEKKIKEMSLDLASDILSHITKNLFTNEEQEKILKRSVEKLEKN